MTEDIKPVIPLNQQGITPEVVAQHFVAQAKDLTAVFIIGFRKDGVVVNLGCGSTQEMALAAVVMQDIVVKTARAAFGDLNGTV